MSVDAKTKALLKARANRIYGGNVSELVTELAREAERRDAFEGLREWAGGSVLDDAERARIDAELDEGWAHARRAAKKKAKKRSAA